MLTIILILAALCLILGLIEVMLVPGFGVAGISSVVCAIACAACIYNEYGLWPCAAAVVAGLVFLFIVLRWLSRSRTFDKMALHTSIDSTAPTAQQLAVKVGDEGKALTRLALVGNAEIGGQVVEVKSSGDFINPQTPVRVIAVSEAQITVEAIK